MNDQRSLELLRLLHEYVGEYAPDIPQTIPALAEDLAMSIDPTTNEADLLRREIEEMYA